MIYMKILGIFLGKSSLQIILSDLIYYFWIGLFPVYSSIAIIIFYLTNSLSASSIRRALRYLDLVIRFTWAEFSYFQFYSINRPIYIEAAKSTLMLNLPDYPIEVSPDILRSELTYPTTFWPFLRVCSACYRSSLLLLLVLPSAFMICSTKNGSRFRGASCWFWCGE